jgi:hypothetical protein
MTTRSPMRSFFMALIKTQIARHAVPLFARKGLENVENSWSKRSWQRIWLSLVKSFVP